MENILENKYTDSELVIGLVSTIGTDVETIKNTLKSKLGEFDYSVVEIKVSKDVIRPLSNDGSFDEKDQYNRISQYMTAGNNLRLQAKDNSILAIGAAQKINESREVPNKPREKTAFIIDSLKHPEEIKRLRQIYSQAFVLIGIHADEERRLEHLTKKLKVKKENALELLNRDEHENKDHGQHTRNAFHLSDFFIHWDGNLDKFSNDVSRIFNLMFGHPYLTPTFDEFAMYMAFSSALRSCDLSRQVGAVVAKDNYIISTGANDVPKAGGGLYWPEYDSDKRNIIDKEGGRDYKIGEDSNAKQQQLIIESILNNMDMPIDNINVLREQLEKSRIGDLTEYGRAVHAEMEALLSCSINGASTSGATLYCTTFPCHNCAKHILTSGIKRVVYIQPYPKSKTKDFHEESISFGLSKKKNNSSDKVLFEPFVGVGPRNFYNLFSTDQGAGYPIIRKDAEGNAVEWNEGKASLRMPLLPVSYLERETWASSIVKKFIESKQEGAEL